MDNKTKQLKLNDIDNELKELFFKRNLFPKEYQLKLTRLNARIARLLNDKKKLQETVGI